MKKTLIALAAVAATGAAFAQSSVTIYGIADAALIKDAGKSAALKSGQMSSNRIGFKGTEDLGGGLQATFVLEQGFDLETGAAKTTNSGATAAFSRESSVGLAGSFGAVKLGRFKSAFDAVASDSNPLWDSELGPVKAGKMVFIGKSAPGKSYLGSPDQGVMYTTPNFSGFTASLNYSFDQTAGTASTVKAFNVKYAGGPVKAVLAYQDQSDASNLTFTNLNGSYDFGVVKLLGSYSLTNDKSAANKDATEYSLGLDIPVAPNTVVGLGYGYSKLKTEASAAKGFSIGVSYSLSKRTTVYGGYYNANANGVANRAAPDDRFGFGLKHQF